MDTYEKKYKKSLERARIWQDHLNENGDKDYADKLNYIFPELVESEDEKVRKSLIDLVINYGDRYGNKQNMLVWLEKQSQQKPVESQSEKELTESYLAVFDKKYPILPTLKGKQLADFKNFLNKCQQEFGLKNYGVHPTQSKLFEKLTLLWATWGAEHLQGIGKSEIEDTPAK